MKPLNIVVTIAFVSASLATFPAAQANEKAANTRTSTSAAKKTRATQKANPASKKKTKNFDFMADDITADRIRPDGTAIFGLQSASHTSLIRLRTEFIAEIVKSAELL